MLLYSQSERQIQRCFRPSVIDEAARQQV